MNRSMITILIDGKEFEVEEGSTLGYVLHDIKHAQIRKTSKKSEPRGLYCGMGVCYECLVTVDDHSGIRSCMTQVHSGMRVATNNEQKTYN